MSLKLKAAVLALCGTGALAFSGNDAVQVVAGLMDGVIQKDDLNQLQTCLTNADQLTTQIQQVVSDFEKGGMSGIMAGITILGQIITALPQDLHNCENIQGDLTKLEQWASIFAHPETLAERVAENMFEHFSEIMGDVNTAMADWNKADYFNFGDQVGTALIAATGGSDFTVDPKVDEAVRTVAEVVGGLLDGIIEGDNL